MVIRASCPKFPQPLPAHPPHPGGHEIPVSSTLYSPRAHSLCNLCPVSTPCLPSLPWPYSFHCPSLACKGPHTPGLTRSHPSCSSLLDALQSLHGIVSYFPSIPPAVTSARDTLPSLSCLAAPSTLSGSDQEWTPPGSLPDPCQSLGSPCDLPGDHYPLRVSLAPGGELLESRTALLLRAGQTILHNPFKNNTSCFCALAPTSSL